MLGKHSRTATGSGSSRGEWVLATDATLFSTPRAAHRVGYALGRNSDALSLTAREALSLGERVFSRRGVGMVLLYPSTSSSPALDARHRNRRFI